MVEVGSRGPEQENDFRHQVQYSTKSPSVFFTVCQQLAEIFHINVALNCFKLQEW